MIRSSNTAPIAALMIAETMPEPRWIPSCGSAQLAINAPAIPTIEIANEAEAGALYDLTGKPAGDEADNQYNEETFAGYVHLCFLHDRTAVPPPRVFTIAPEAETDTEQNCSDVSRSMRRAVHYLV